MDSAQSTDLYPPIEPYHTGTLDVGDGHSLYFEVAGNPNGTPVVFLHGGPGAGTNSTARRFFDPNHYRIVLFDQRGAGRSTPKAATDANTTWHLVDDLERLRAKLDIERWMVFGGSWGATLALAYGQSHPDRCLGFVLRGIFLGEAAELDWFLNGMKAFFPQAGRAFEAHVEGARPGQLLEAYQRRLNDPDPAIHLGAARAWARYENACSTLLPTRTPPDGGAFDTYALALARIEVHYFINHMFLEPGQLLGAMKRIAHLPATLIQGRYDVICPPTTAQRLHDAWPRSRLEIISDAGHSAMEPGIRRALSAAADAFRHQGG